MVSVVVGHDGWLFLGDDTNASIRQFKGQLTIGETERLKWVAYHHDVNSLASNVGCDHIFMIAPSKESIWTDYYPYKDEADMAIIRYLSAFPHCVYQRDLLHSARNVFPTYPKTNTHWNDWVAYVSIRNILERVERKVPEIPRDEFEVRPGHFGDLGNKLDPQVSADTISHKSNFWDFRIYDNKIVNNGRVWIYENKAAILDQVCLLYGDSFSTNLAKFLARWFRRLVYVHTTPIDASFALKEKPDLIIYEVAERFLIRAPTPMAKFNIKDVIAEKIRKEPPDLAAELITKQRELWPDFSC